MISAAHSLYIQQISSASTISFCSVDAAQSFASAVPSFFNAEARHGTKHSKTNDDRLRSTARDRTSKHTHPSSTWRPQEAQSDRGMFGRYGISVPVTDPHACLVPQAHAQPTMSYRCQGLLTPPCPECGGWQLTNCAGQLLLKQQASQGRAVTATPQCLPRTHTHTAVQTPGSQHRLPACAPLTTVVGVWWVADATRQRIQIPASW